MLKKPSFGLLLVLGLSSVLLGAYMALLYAPPERTMGDIQRIFYIHVPSAWISFLAFFIVFVSSIAYLARGRPIWDVIAASSAELGLLFCTISIVTGALWAKPAWGRFWAWDMRLTTTLVLWFMYISYFMVRSYADGERAPRLASVFGIVGFIDVPMVYLSVKWWRTMHPGYVVTSRGGLAPEMLLSLILCLVAFTLLYSLLLTLRIRMRLLEIRVDSISEAG